MAYIRNPVYTLFSGRSLLANGRVVVEVDLDVVEFVEIQDRGAEIAGRS
jgi:hypothetical protein